MKQKQSSAENDASCLYEVSVMHQRLYPKRHRFCHNFFWFYLDLDSVERLSRRFWWLGYRQWALYAFYPQDHCPFGDDSRPLKKRLLAWLAHETGEGQTLEARHYPAHSKVFLLTQPRCLGYSFNPVSFYFIEPPANCPLAPIALAEVGNTFGEKKLYALPESPNEEGAFSARLPKEFYVSPFSALTDHFHFYLRQPGQRLTACVNTFDQQQGPVLVSTMTGKRYGFHTLSLGYFTCRYPLVTLKIILFIHIHALLLWIKRLPYYEKFANLDLQRGVLRKEKHLAAFSKKPHF